MNLTNKILEAKRLIGLVEGAKAYISDKGRVKMKLEFSKSEKVIAELTVKKGVVYVFHEGKQIEPARESKPEQKKGKDISDMRGASDEIVSKAE